jgi:hypothetical protein
MIGMNNDNIKKGLKTPTCEVVLETKFRPTDIFYVYPNLKTYAMFNRYGQKVKF